MKKPTDFLISRNYVEFGPFSSEEILAFRARGILLESDYVKESGGHVWAALAEWLAAHKSGASAVAATKVTVKKRATKPKSAA